MRQSMLWLMAAAAGAAAAAVMAQPVPAALQACVHITQDSERLACFDREMAAASQKAGTPAAAASRPAQSPAGNAAASPARAPASASTALTGAGAVGATAGAAAASAASPSPAAASPATASMPPAASAPSALPAASAPVAPSAAGTATATSVAGTAPKRQAAVPLTPEDELGLSAEGIRKLEVERGIVSTDVKQSKELTAHVANVSRNAAGRAVLTLDNGQVWLQSETRSTFEARAGDTVKITPGAMGSFWIATSTHNRTRVERLP